MVLHLLFDILGNFNLYLQELVVTLPYSIGLTKVLNTHDIEMIIFKVNVDGQ